VGLVTGVCLSAKGHNVTCLDIDPTIVKKLNQGKPHIYEKGLQELLSYVISTGLFKAILAGPEALEGSDITIIAVGTPSVDGSIDLSSVGSAGRLFARYLKESQKYSSVVLKSTAVPGATDTYLKNIIEQESGMTLGEFGLGMNPEFLREGEAIEDFMEPDRIVIGYEDNGTKSLLEELYSPWNCNKLFVNTRTAEMIKYANNCLLATQISAVNELANIAAAIGGVDIQDVMEGIHLDKRWSPILKDGQRVYPGILTYLRPGCGFGGSCFPKDVEALLSQARLMSVPARILEAVLETNKQQPLEIIRLLESGLGTLKGKRVTVLGLAFKPGTDDIRESPALTVIPSLLDCGAEVSAADPIAFRNAEKHFSSSDISIHADWRRAVKGADAVVVLTSWQDFIEIEPDVLMNLMEGDLIVDARAILNRDKFRDFRLIRIGCTPRRDHKNP
jgi:UDPglucose 6-dehydrogenase